MNSWPYVSFVSRWTAQLPVSRVTPVLPFMSYLFNDNTHNWRPSVLAQGAKHGRFKQVFKDSCIYFSHFIKVHEYKVINRKYLTAMIVRGAAVLCANCQSGVDMIIPFLYGDNRIERSNVGAILMQVKNDPKYTRTPREALFDKMDPYELESSMKMSPPYPLSGSSLPLLI